MGVEEIRQHVDAIKDYVSGVEKIKDSNGVHQIKLQLHMVEKAIKQMNKAGIQAPEGLISDKLSLEAKIAKIGEGPLELSRLYEELLDIVDQVGLKMQRRPHKDLYLRIKERKKQTTPGEVLRKSILKVLREMGGSGPQREILDGVLEELKAQFTQADLEIPYGKNHRWEINALKERNRMIKQGILSEESKRKKWSLKK